MPKITADQLMDQLETYTETAREGLLLRKENDDLRAQVASLTDELARFKLNHAARVYGYNASEKEAGVTAGMLKAAQHLRCMGVSYWASVPEILIAVREIEKRAGKVTKEPK